MDTQLVNELGRWSLDYRSQTQLDRVSHRRDRGDYCWLSGGLCLNRFNFGQKGTIVFYGCAGTDRAANCGGGLSGLLSG